MEVGKNESTKKLPNILVIEILNQYLDGKNNEQLVYCLEKLKLVCKSWCDGILNKLQCGYISVSNRLDLDLFKMLVKTYSLLGCKIETASRPGADNGTLVNEEDFADYYDNIQAIVMNNGEDDVDFVNRLKGYGNLNTLYYGPRNLKKIEFPGLSKMIYGDHLQLPKEKLRRLGMKLPYNPRDNQFDMKELVENVSRMSPKIQKLKIDFHRESDDNEDIEKDLLPHFKYFETLTLLPNIKTLEFKSMNISISDLSAWTSQMKSLEKLALCDVDIEPMDDKTMSELWEMALEKFYYQHTIKTLELLINHRIRCESIIDLLNHNDCITSVNLHFTSFSATEHWPKDFSNKSISNRTLTDLKSIQLDDDVMLDLLGIWRSPSSLQLLPKISDKNQFENLIRIHNQCSRISLAVSDASDLVRYLSISELPYLNSIVLYATGIYQVVDFPKCIRDAILLNCNITTMISKRLSFKFKDFIDNIITIPTLTKLKISDLDKFDIPKFTDRIIESKSLKYVSVKNIHKSQYVESLNSIIESFTKICRYSSTLSVVNYPFSLKSFKNGLSPLQSLSKELEIIKQISTIENPIPMKRKLKMSEHRSKDYLKPLNTMMKTIANKTL
ncbi:hypothetical protein DLAC_07208 [Tieghemostelium lacteum]|uniref:Uncharacterized protein n=1 Tax=Tieghemostelium lacteum TaxID=361077 RepID=A0A151ZD41_TIELA|nr:hypothetical protein DLAC_07208 [Tieghemostelium lacteum]|eukprot:KYQ91872.1 hypothetical protein DLAC_07208 [Tieghemostelium lacteum]